MLTGCNPHSVLIYSLLFCRLSPTSPHAHVLIALQALSNLAVIEENIPVIEEFITERVLSILIAWMEDVPAVADLPDDTGMLTRWLTHVVPAAGTDAEAATKKVPTFFPPRLEGRNAFRNINWVAHYEPVRKRELRQRREEQEASAAKRPRITPMAEEETAKDFPVFKRPTDISSRNAALRLRDMSVCFANSLVQMSTSTFPQRLLENKHFISRLVSVLRSPFGSQASHVLAMEALSTLTALPDSYQYIHPHLASISHALLVLPKLTPDVQTLINKVKNTAVVAQELAAAAALQPPPEASI
jgi:hypothetical protein